jgi:hypothetical protein
MTTARRSWSRFVAAIAALVVVAVGIPAGLIACSRITLASRHPLPGIGTTDEIRAWFDRELSSAEIAPILLRLLLTVAWLLWVGLMSSVIAALVSSRPQLGPVRLPRMAMFDGVAVWIASGLTALSSLAPNVAHSAPPPPVAAVVASPDATEPGRTHLVDQPTRIGHQRVQPGESIEMFASRTLGDPSRWPEVWELNKHRSMDTSGATWSEPWRIHAGWQLELPATSTTISPDESTIDPEASATARDSPAPETVAVPDGGSYWSIAENHLEGSLDRDPTGHEIYVLTEALVAHNAPRLGHDDPSMLYPGDLVELVNITTTPPPPSDAVTAGSGDSYWTIAATHLREVHHREATGNEVLEATRTLIAQNAPRLGYDDPTMLHPGDTIDVASIAAAAKQPPSPTVPERPAPPDRPTRSPERSPEGVSPEQPPRVPVDGPDETPDQPVARERPEPTRDDPGRVRTGTVPPAPVNQSRDVRRPAGDPPVSVEADDDAGWFEFTPRTVWWQVPIGFLLAAGVVAQLRRLRGRRMRDLLPGEQFTTPPPVAGGVELAAATAAPASRLATLRTLLRSVTPHAREFDDPPPVRAVSAASDRIEILFADPAPFPPNGWSTVDGGMSWVYELSGDVPVGVRQLLTPALVTVGRRADGSDLLLDVETAGSVGLAGDRQAALGLVRSMTLELATYPLGVPMDVLLIGLDVDGTEDCDRTWAQTTLTRAVRVARDTLERQAATGAASLMAARAASDVDDGSLDPAVFVVDTELVTSDADQALLDELVELCQPQTGAAVILVGPPVPTVRETITLESETSARWLGVEVTPPVIDPEAVAELAVTFDHAANATTEPVTTSPVVADMLALHEIADDAIVDVLTGHTGNGDTAEVIVPYRYQPPDHDVMVQLLDEVTVHGVKLNTAADVELVALLACLRDRNPNIDVITTMLDREHDVEELMKDEALTISAVRSRMSRLRAKLGVGSDGEPLIPLAQSGRGSPGRYSVSPRVVTDVDLIQHRYLTSLDLTSHEAVEVLRDGLVLFTGPPFRTRKAYHWPWPEGVTLDIYAVVQQYAARLMELAMEGDDLALVLQTVGRTAMVIEDPVHQQPVRLLEEQYAEATGDPQLTASVAAARRRLREFADENDRIVGT